MQSSAILVFALAVASGFAVPLQDQSEDRMKDLVSAVTDFLSSQEAKLKPINLPPIHADTSKIPIIGHLISSKTNITNATYYGYNVAAFENIRTYPGHLEAQLTVRQPKLAIDGKYELMGTVLGHDVAKGAGDFSLEYLNLTYSFRHIRLFETEKKALRVARFGLGMDLEDIKFNVTGLNIEGLSTPTFERIAEAVAHQYFNFKKGPTAVAAEIALIVKVNKLIGDRTLEEVVEYLKEHKDDDFFHHEHQEMFAQLFKA